MAPPNCKPPSAKHSHAWPHPNAVRLTLEHRREQRQAPPPVVVELPANIKARDAHVTPHNLESYDQLKEPTDE